MKKSDNDFLEVLKWSGVNLLCGAGIAGITLGLSYLLHLWMKFEATTVYGIWLFITLCLVTGIISGMIAHRVGDREGIFNFWVALCSYFLFSFVVMIFAFEGAICLAMAFFLVVPLNWLGLALGGWVASVLESRNKMYASALPLILLPAVDSAIQSREPNRVVEVSSVVINATPEKIWPFLFHLEEIPPPTNVLFILGVAHPVHIDSTGETAGSTRNWGLSTGNMPGLITKVEKNKRVVFRVDGTPKPMHELNPFGEVNAIHDHHYYEVESGEFVLEPLSGGRTRLTGVSTYRHRLYPGGYWTLWTDSVVEQVHLMELNEIKRRAELD